MPDPAEYVSQYSVLMFMGHLYLLRINLAAFDCLSATSAFSKNFDACEIPFICCTVPCSISSIFGASCFMNFQNSSNALKSDSWKSYLDNAIKQYNNNPISNAQKIQKWVLLGEDLTIQNNCMTPTMKLKRAKIYERFEKEIESMY